MGCNDSKSMRRVPYGSSFYQISRTQNNESRIYPKDSSNERISQNYFGDNSRLIPFYEDLQDMYKASHKDFRKFIRMIEERVSEIYMEISRQTLTGMNHEEIAAQQSKIIISEEILSLNLNILKVIGRNTNFEYDKETFKELNKFQSNLVGYLKTKYPRGQQTFVSGDLMKIFKEFDRVNDLDYDILKNSNTYFGEPDEDKIIKGVKLFINKIINQCDKYFPEFEKLMQDRAFFLKNDKGEKTNLNYKIGRKIPDNVAKYEKLDSGVLQIFSPQVFRVLIKWMQDLEETIQNTSEKISKKQSFKCYVGQKPTNDANPGLIKEEKELLFDYVNQYEYDKIVDKLISRIEGLKPKLDGKNKEFVSQLDEFNQRFLKILNQADPKQKYVPAKQIETIKYSSFNAKFVEYILTEKLVYVIKELIKVGQTFISENTMNLDVIKFRVTDLMRCQVSGNKKEILQIYNNFRRLEEEGKIEIIKIKNRLSTPLNDAMLIFVMKDSWIICEAQLILSEAGEKVDKKSKNTELVNHYFYELERSPYGIMAEIAVLLTYKDSKILYENKITFNESEVDIERCKAKHQNSVIEIQEQNIPFICSKCSSFYPKSQNLFKYYQCKECKTAICSKCILKRNPQLENSFIMRDINRKLQQKLTQLEKSGRQKRQAGGKSKNGGKKMTPKSILNLFEPERIKFKEKFDKNEKKGGIRKVQCSRLMSQLADEYGIDRRDDPKYFLVVNFSRGEAGFKLYSYDPQYKEIENTADSRQKYEESSYFSYSEYDLLFMLAEECNREPAIKDKHLFLFLTQNELQAKINQTQKLKAEGKINKDENYQIVSVQLIDSTTQLVLDYLAIQDKKKDNRFDDGVSEEGNTVAVEKKEFKYPSLTVLGEKLPALKSARTSIEFDDLGIQTKHLDYFRDLSWRHSIKELKLANNKLEDITILFDNLNSLQRFYFNDNYVKELKFNKPIPNLQIINGSKNYIASIQGLSNIKQIRKLLLQTNKLKEFPKCKDLTVLNVLNLKTNYLSNVSNILSSEFPELQQLIISGQLVEFRQYDNEESEEEGQGIGGFFGSIWRRTGKQELMAIEYPKLKNFESQDNNNLLVGKQVAFYSQSLQKISLNNCKIDRIVFNKRQCMQNLKYLHLSGNKIQYFSFLSASQPRNNRRGREDSMSMDSQFDSKPVSNDSLIELVLSNNQIQYLPIMRFSSLKRLELQGNKIAEIRSLQKSKIYELQYLDLGNNPFTTIYTMYFPKLTTLRLQQMKQLQNVDTLFKGPSQLPCLQNIYFTYCQKIDFTFDLNEKTNWLTKLKELFFDGVNFTTSLKKQGAIFQSSTLESLTLDNCTFGNFPVLKLPKITNLTLNSVSAQSFRNLEHSKLPQLTSFSMNGVKQNHSNSSIVKKSIIQSKRQQKSTDLDKFLTCDLSFPKLKDLNLVNSNIGSLKGLGNYNYNELEYLELKDLKTIDKQLPKIKAPNIKSIEIIGIPISNVDNFLGHGFSKLTNLYLENNEIESINEHTLGSLTEIKTLSIYNNKLKKFSCSKYLDKLVHLDLSSNQIKSFPRIKAKNLSDIRWKGNAFTDLNELQNCDLPALEIIQLENCDLSKSGLPRLNMPGLQTLNITESKLADVSNLARSYLPSLRQMNLTNNQIVDFPKINAPKLEDLYLEQNKIKNVQFLKQSKFESLSILRLGSNLFTRLPNDIQLAHLKTFQCSNIQLDSLPALEFPELQEIDIQYAQLNNISQFAKGEYKSLKELNLSNNKITYLPRVEMESLIVVVIDNNLIDDLSDFFDSDLPLMELQWLSFENNKIQKVPNIMFSNIKSIYFNDNPLTEFNSLTLLEYPELNGLYFNNTQISKFRLPRLPKLEEIEMDGSKVDDLNWLVNSGPNLPKLNKICVKNCSITRLPNMDLLQSLKEIQVTGNPITNVEGFMSSQLFLSKRFVQFDLDVGSDFEKMKSKIIKLNPEANVQVYRSLKE